MFTHADKIAVLGYSGSGKTTLARTLQRFFPRAVVVDRMREYSGERGTRYVTGAAALRGLLGELRGARRFRIVFQFPATGGDERAEFEAAVRAVYAHGSTLLCVDEIQLFCSPSWAPDALREFIFTGRHRRCPLMVTSQRPARVAKDLLSMTTAWYCGQLWERGDLDYLRDVMGEIAEQIPRVPKFHFLEFRPALRAARIVRNR